MNTQNKEKKIKKKFSIIFRDPNETYHRKGIIDFLVVYCV